MGGPARQDQMDALSRGGCRRGCAAENRKRVCLGMMRKPSDVEDRDLVIFDAEVLSGDRALGGEWGPEPVDVDAQGNCFKSHRSRWTIDFGPTSA